MEKTLLSHPRLKATIFDGVEGPRHDPYGFTEWRIKTPQHEVMFHEGLAVYIMLDGNRLDATGKTYDKPRGWCEAWFLATVGVTIAQVERWYRNKVVRCRMGGHHDLFSWDGYPGETLYECRKCHKIVTSTFDRSAVE